MLLGARIRRAREAVERLLRSDSRVQRRELSASARRGLLALARRLSGGGHGLPCVRDLTSLELLGLDRGRERLRGPVEEGEEGLGVDPDPEAEDDEGDERRELARVQVLEVLVLL